MSIAKVRCCLMAVLLAVVVPFSPTAADDETRQKTCFVASRVLDYDPIDDRQVLAKLRGGKRYILVVEPRCRGLKNAVSYRLSSSRAMACPGWTTRLSFVERSKRGDSCVVEEIHEVVETTPGSDDESNTDGEKG